MKKVASIVAAALVTCSLSACGNRNTAYRTPGTNQGGTNIGMNQGNYNAGVGNTAAYRDGVYLGEGNRTSNGNQAAIITVNGGRITNVVLKTLDAQGKEMYTAGSATGVGTDNGTGTTTGRTGSGTIIGGTNGGGTTTQGSTGWGNTMGGTNYGTTGGTTGGTTSGAITGGNTGTNNTATSNLERVRRDLASAVVSQQTHNVTIANAGNDTASVNNWKLAISRALDSARR